jgi:hypothetical protein|tara:strand:+ start:59 stop:430 length:372 start_codon:yes stop_codon:yes gene_type:complete
MPNKHFCQGPDCHTKTTQDRFLKSRGVVRGRYALFNLDREHDSYCKRAKYFCSTRCESEWLDEHMDNIEQGRPIEFIRHRRESGGTPNLWYEKRTEETHWGNRTTIRKIERINPSEEVDNRSE